MKRLSSRASAAALDAGETMPILYGLDACDTCRKAQNWLKRAGVEHSFIDYREHRVEAATLRDWAKQLHEVALIPAGQEEQLRGMEWPADLLISAIECCEVPQNRNSRGDARDAQDSREL